MEHYLKAIAVVLVAVILILALNRTSNVFAALLSITVCIILAVFAIGYLSPIVAFCNKLNDLGGLRSDMLQILLKVIGIAITSEIAVTICDDAGNKSLGKTLQILTSAVIVYLSLPLLATLLEIIEEILSNI